MTQFSFKGWSARVWLEKNKKWFVENKGTVKWAVAAGFGMIKADNPAVAVLVTGISKAALDAIDYWLSK